MRRLLAYDGAVAATVLRIYWFFGVSALVVVSALPLLIFIALVGWQSSHLALLLGAGVLLPLGPAICAAITAMTRFVDDGDYPGQLGRTYWSAFGRAASRLWWWWVPVFAVTLLLSYDIALFGTSDLMLLLVTVFACLLALMTAALGLQLDSTGPQRPVAMVTRVVQAIARRPLIALTRAAVIVGAVLVLTIPAIGPSLALVAPSIAAWVLVVIDRTGATPS